MDIQTILSITGAVCAVLITLVTWGFITGRFVARRENDFHELDKFMLEVNRRFDEANKEMSRAMSHVQTLESRFSRDFMSRDIGDTRFGEHRRELDHLRSELERLKDGLANTRP